jgi:alpha-beta hydrolase superfamily lysophospholipase
MLRQTEDMTQTDILGPPYTCETIALPDDAEGEVVATLVRRRADRSPVRGAVLHVHGFCDYFFQEPQADFFTGLGYDFYALDLRKYGRSLLAHQTPNFCIDLAEYYAELDIALDLVMRRDAHETLVVGGHSAGGLIVSLWAAERGREGHRVADAFVLNSPWLDLQGPFYVRTAGTEAINRLGQRRPYAVVPRTVTGVYAESLHRDLRGEWDYDLAWKPTESFPVRAGWLRAMRMGHRTVHRGIDVKAPVITLCSTESLVAPTWTDGASAADTVLDVRQIAKWSHQLGRDVTVVRVEGAIHDVFSSRKDVRDVAFGHVERWLGYALGGPSRLT